MAQELTEQEWSHFYDVDDLESKPEKLTIEASEEECQDIARRFQIVAVKSAQAQLTLKRTHGGRVIYVSGRFTAQIVQECVVSGEPVETVLTDQVEGWFADKDPTVSFTAAKRERDADKSGNREIEIMSEEDDPEPIINGVIDLGELVTQHISLALPPFPQKEGVFYPQGDEKLKINDLIG